MGANYAISATYLVVLTIAQFTGMSQYMSALVLASMARHRVLALLVLVEGVVNLVLSIVLIHRMGLIGVAWGTVIPDVICTAIVIPWYTLKQLNLDVREYFGRAFVRPVISVLPAAVLAYLFSRVAVTPTWVLFGGEVAVICGTVAVMSYFFCLDPWHRDRAHRRLRSVFQRAPIVHEG